MLIARQLMQARVFFFVLLGAGAVVERFFPLRLAGYAFATGIAAGALLFTIAVAVAASALKTMSRHATSPEPGHAPAHLVTTGPFRFTRNPMYLGLVVAATAIAVMVDSFWLAMSALLLLVAVDRLVIPDEERTLAATFGGDFEAYRGTVRRWL